MLKRTSGCIALVTVATLGAFVTGCSSNDNAKTTASTGTTTTTLKMQDVPFKGDAASPWCQQVPNVAATGSAVAALDLPTSKPEDIDARFTALTEQLDIAVPLSPVEIQPQVEAYARDVAEEHATLKAANFDMSAIDAVTMQRLTEEINSTGQIIDKYNRDVCTGVVANVPASTPVVGPNTVPSSSSPG